MYQLAYLSSVKTERVIILHSSHFYESQSYVSDYQTTSQYK